MSTFSTDQLNGLASDWDSGMDYPSATLSGIVPDQAHLDEGGYHVSIEDQVNPNNYSVVRADDKAPPGNWSRNRAAAIDMSMNTADMIKCWNRVFVVWQNRATDPRAKYFNAFNGWNGVGSAERLDFVTGSRTTASADHKWHNHDETRRRYVNDPEMRRAKASVYRGETVQQYLGTTNANPLGGKKMMLGKIGSNPAIYQSWDGRTRQQVMADQGDALPALASAGYNVVNFNSESDCAAFMGPVGERVQFNATVSNEQIDLVAERAANAVIARADNPLTPADLAGVKQSVKDALSEGVNG